MASATISCPHCSAANVAGSQFCESCGKALPSVFSGGPRVVDGSGFASTAAGQKLQSDELSKQARKASGALLTVAIIQTVMCGIVVMIANSNKRLDFLMQNGAFLGIAGAAGIFWGLYFWARRQPLPAAIVGLVLYVTLVAVNVILSARQMAKGGVGNGGFGGVGVGWLDIVIIVVLAQAITAGSKYRKMMQTSM